MPGARVARPLAFRKQPLRDDLHPLRMDRGYLVGPTQRARVSRPATRRSDGSHWTRVGLDGFALRVWRRRRRGEKLVEVVALGGSVWTTSRNRVPAPAGGPPPARRRRRPARDSAGVRSRLARIASWRTSCDLDWMWILDCRAVAVRQSKSHPQSQSTATSPLGIFLGCRETLRCAGHSVLEGGSSRENASDVRSAFWGFHHIWTSS